MLNVKQRENGVGFCTFPLWHIGGMSLQYSSFHSGSAAAYDAGILRATKSLCLNTLSRSYAVWWSCAVGWSYTVCTWRWKG